LEKTEKTPEKTRDFLLVSNDQRWTLLSLVVLDFPQDLKTCIFLEGSTTYQAAKQPTRSFEVTNS
jgi:hypothetical protein